MKSKSAKFVNCPCIGATLDKLIQPAILAILVEGPSYGYELSRKIAEVPGFVDEAPDISGVYRLLKSLESRGMVVSELGVTEEGRAKRLFSITENGRDCLRRWNKTLRNYRKSIDSLLKLTQKAVDSK